LILRSIDTAFAWDERVYPGKRVLDVVGALLGLILTAPLLLLIAVVVKFLSPGPVLYRGVRAGLAGRPFKQIKFRTMRMGAKGSAFTARDDDRLIPLGRVLRLLKLDELPQFINVLRGEMSLVGPRPEDAEVVHRLYTPEQLRVLSVRPGITGLLQVRVFPDFTCDVPKGVDPANYYSSTILPRRLEEDLEYVDRMSFFLDFKILIQTAGCIMLKSWAFLFRRRREPVGKWERT